MAKVDDLVPDMSRLNIEMALQHAATISLMPVERRSIGPDQPLWSERAYSNSGDKDDTENAAAVAPLPKAKKSIVKPMPQPLTPVSNFPDINALNSSIVKRELSQQCKRSVRLQLNALHEQRQQAAASKKQSVAQLNAEQQEERAKRLVIKQESDLQIQQRAEQLTFLELEEQRHKLKAMRQRAEQKLQEISYKGVARHQAKFRIKYEGITKILLSLDKETQKALGPLNRQLRELVIMFDQLIGKIKAGTCGPPELKVAEEFFHTLSELDLNLHKELMQISEQAAQQQQQLKIDEANKAKLLSEEKEKQRALAADEESKKQQEQLEAKQQAEAAATAAAAIPIPAATAQNQAEAETASPPAPPTPPTATDGPPAPPTSISSSYVHPAYIKRLAFFSEINQLYQAKVERVKPLQTDESWKKYRTNCQRAINMPLNAITAVSAQHLTLNFEKLYNFFAGQPAKTTDGGAITINDHPLARDYCLLLMAKKFVSQSETAISSNPQAAFPFASVIVTFWKLLPDFGNTYLAYIYKESPYLVPTIMPQQPGQTPEQYLKSVGYRLSERNELEKPDMYLKRQTGIARLYAAVIITPGRKADGHTHPFGIEQAWSWLIHMVHLKPLPDISATMMMEMLNTIGYELWRSYGKQFMKLLLYIQQHYIPQLTAYDESGPKMRLEMLLAKFLRERQIPQPVGVLPPGFW